MFLVGFFHDKLLYCEVDGDGVDSVVWLVCLNVVFHDYHSVASVFVLVIGLEPRSRTLVSM